MARLLPDAERLMLALLRPTFPGVSLGTAIPDDLGNRVPYIVIRRVGGAAIDGRFLDQAVMSVDAWHTSKSDASELADDVRAALLEAWEAQTVTDFGHLAYFREEAAPSELRTGEQPDTLYRYLASYTLAIRPPRRAGPVPAPSPRG